jgi:hypothetical protein
MYCGLIPTENVQVVKSAHTTDIDSIADNTNSNTAAEDENIF